MRKHTTYIQLSERELDLRVQEAGRHGAEAALERLEHVKRKMQVLMGFADKATLAAIFEVSEATIERWDKRHEFKRVDGPRRDRNYYDLEDIKQKVRATAAHPSTMGLSG